MGTVASKSPGEMGGAVLANSLEQVPIQDSHTAAPQEVAELDFSQHWAVEDTLSIKKKKKSFPFADNTSLKIWPTYWQVFFFFF